MEITIRRDSEGKAASLAMSGPFTLPPQEAFRRSVMKIPADALGITPAAAKALGGEFTLRSGDLEDFQEAEIKLWMLFRDGREHTQSDMEKATGQRQADRRMRRLRSVLRSRGWTIRPRRDEPTRLYYYRLCPAQLGLETSMGSD